MVTLKKSSLYLKWTWPGGGRRGGCFLNVWFPECALKQTHVCNLSKLSIFFTHYWKSFRARLRAASLSSVIVGTQWQNWSTWWLKCEAAAILELKISTEEYVYDPDSVQFPRGQLVRSDCLGSNLTATDSCLTLGQHTQNLQTSVSSCTW